MKRLTGPRSRAGRYRSSQVFMAWRILALLSERESRCWAASSLRVRGTLARARAAASASLRVGVGRPLPPVLSAASCSTTGVDSDLLRRNTGGLRLGDGATYASDSIGHRAPRRCWRWGQGTSLEPRPSRAASGACDGKAEERRRASARRVDDNAASV